jgi:hypothetical protein
VREEMSTLSGRMDAQWIPISIGSKRFSNDLFARLDQHESQLVLLRANFDHAETTEASPTSRPVVGNRA